MKKIFIILILSMPLLAEDSKTVSDIFKSSNANQIVMDIEAALARAQASQGIIPLWAAEEITKKAEIKYMPNKEVSKEQAIVRHRLVARLNVWKRSIELGAEEYLHFGATTVDIFDTLLVIQVNQSIELLINDLLDIEEQLLEITKNNIDTFMAGRTIGQHALPITFGKKTSTWLAENRRNIERLQHVKTKVEQSGILKGAVGTYLGLGEKAIETEALMMLELGLSKPSVADWHGIRDVFAEYGLTLALISKSFGRMGEELTLLQMTEFGETLENLGNGAVGSSTMPQKRNPRGPGNLIEASRVIPRISEIILDDMINSFERDGAKSDSEIQLISIAAEDMIDAAKLMLSQLEVNKEMMRNNLDKTKGLILSQRVTFELGKSIGKDSANDLMHDVAMFALKNNLTLREAIKRNSKTASHFSEPELDELLNPETYIGLAIEQTKQIIKEIEEKRIN
ncbi:lyase family protein [Gammaproteobacteria bacterium]|jgi:adenylosuccinate lyase|nr:lyase family protein [Gammaproteobacteria bacterium]|tara:strand:+ start:3784 stop:5148 length:1365 start_codon:yes stop_codon:yes gene_type:complete